MAMAFDGLMLKASIDEIRSEISTGRVTKIYQLSKYEILIIVRQQRQNKKLLFSVHPSYARTQLTKLDYTYPDSPPMFCMFLRKHLEGAIVEAIEQVNDDRIIKFTLASKSEFGGETKKYVYVEIMGKHSNFTVVNEDGKILDCIKHLSPIMNSHRTLQPGAEYVLPPAHDKQLPYDISALQFSTVIGEGLDVQPSKLTKQFAGMSKLIAKEVVFRSESGEKRNLYGAFAEVMDQIENHPTPCITVCEGREDFHIIELSHLTGDVKAFSTIGLMLDAFYFGKEAKDRVRDQFANVLRFVDGQYDKNVKKREKLARDLDRTERAEEYRIKGELILANIHQIKKGDKLVRVPNFYAEDLAEMDIALDVRVGASENSQKYFKRYNKAKVAVEHIQAQMVKTEQEIAYFESLKTHLETADIKDVHEIKEELQAGGYLKKQVAKGKKKIGLPKPEVYVAPLASRTSDGVKILVGKNNLQNDYITHKLAKRLEWWFHAKDMPGSHVVVRSSEDELSEATIRCAANLAAYFSKGRNSSSVAIDYTQIKNIKKVPNSHLGFVTYVGQKTIYIDPDESEVMGLEKIRS